MSRELRLLCVVGARPQFVKAAAILRAVDRANERTGGLPIRPTLVHTGQHYDIEMSQVFFDDLGLPPPDRLLGLGSGSHGVQTGRMLAELEPVIVELEPDVVVVVGDTNSTLAGALAAAKLNVPVAHVEAGMRSWRRDMPEETNRRVADHVSTLLFCSTPTGVANLEGEGITDGVVLSGDVMHEVLLEHLSRMASSCAPVTPPGLEPKTYALATVHRAHNTDDTERLASIVKGLERVAESMPVVFPMHPRARAALHGASIAPDVIVVDPVGYDDMIRLERSARVILTDSGGVQKEALWLGVPCVTLREETEWPETLECGWNVLAGTDPEAVLSAAVRPPPTGPPSAELAVSDASDRIIGAIVDWKSRAST